MKYGSIAGSDKPVARLIQGTTMLATSRQSENFRLLDEILAAGGQTFDTAHQYANGESERVLGDWMQSRGNRADIVLVTKGAHHNADRQRVTPFDITSDLHDSLARLKTDRIDLYLLHRDDATVAVEEIVDVLNAHIRAGKIGAIGASNWSVSRIQAANAYARGAGLTPFVASSPNYSLAVQLKSPWPNCVSISGPDGKGERSWYQTAAMPILAWSSLAGGFLSGRYPLSEEAPTDQDAITLDCYGSAENFQRLARAGELAAERGVAVPQIALAYVLNQPLDVYPLMASATGAEFAENARALEINLSHGEIEYLDLRADPR